MLKPFYHRPLKDQKVNIDNKKKLENMVNGTKGQFMALSKKIMKMVGR